MKIRRIPAAIEKRPSTRKMVVKTALKVSAASTASC
jgi:hypothetical protein